MNETERLSTKFYQALGKLFYAIAAVDKNVRDEEYDKLKEIVKSHWLDVDDFEDDFHTDAAYQIEIVFDWLYKENKLDAQLWFKEFIDYKEEHEAQFTDKMKRLILKTANAVAASFSGKNKSELIMLARLSINLR